MAEEQKWMRPVKFVHIVPVVIWVNPQVSALQSNGGMWTVLYALDEDGTVWWWSGAGWTQCGPQPTVQA